MFCDFIIGYCFCFLGRMGVICDFGEFGVLLRGVWVWVFING